MRDILNLISRFVGMAGVAIIIYGVALMLTRLIRMEIKRAAGRKHVFNERNALRHQLGSYLLLGLEFLIAADIIGTVTHPTLNDMAMLGSIVAIRTVLSFFLDKDVEKYKPVAGD